MDSNNSTNSTISSNSQYQGNENKVNVKSFLSLKVLGKGSYGKVILVREIDDGMIFAMKILKKKLMEQKKQVEHVKTEQNILAHIKHPFVIKLSYSFQTHKKLYFVMEFCQGGELFNLLSKKKRFTEDQCRFYASQIVLAIGHLHQQDVIYRDLKPENVLLDKDGYIRITDFGLSKDYVQGNDVTYSLCGTPEYLAPEIIQQKGHTKYVDWWTLGCLIYELVTGHPPFLSQKRDELFSLITKTEIQLPSYITETCKDLLLKLFAKDPTKRIGYISDSEEIKEHEWFANVNWDYLQQKKYKAPFTPVIKGDLDTQNFAQEFTEIQIESFTPSNNEQLSSNYENFTFESQSLSKK